MTAVGRSWSVFQLRAGAARRRQASLFRLKSNIDDVGLVPCRRRIYYRRGSRGNNAISPRTRFVRERRVRSCLQCSPLDVANNAVIAAGENDGCNQMSAIARLAHWHCMHLISSLYWSTPASQLSLHITWRSYLVMQL